MLEIEIKSPCNDLRSVERMVLKRGGEKKGEVEQVDSYYSHPCRDFSITDEALRLRSDRNGFVLHYKGPKIDALSKSREEIAFPLGDHRSLVQILERLGFRLVATVQKKRSIYVLGGIEISLDRVKGLGDFVELEIKDEELEEGRARLLELMNELGLENNERRSYLELLLEKER